MEEEPKKVVKIKVTDKRRDHAHTSDPNPKEEGTVASEEAFAGGVGGAAPSEDRDAEVAVPDEASGPGAESHDYLGDLQRLQAEFDNYRKRSLRDQTAAGDRAAGRVIEELLPVLDNFERAIAHGEGGEGVQLVFKDFKAVLERLGLEEVPSEGASFDPNVHDAVESREVGGLEEAAIIEVYRRGYLHKGQLLRPATVVVGRPGETGGLSTEQSVEAQ